MTRASFTATIAALCTGLVLVACGESSGGGAAQTDANAKVTIEVQGPQEPTDAKTKLTYDLYMKQVQDFQKQHPNITLKPRYWKWNPQTFSAMLSSGQITADYLTSFTDPVAIIPRHQAADITDQIKSWKYYPDLNPQQMKVATSNGRIYGVSSSGFKMALLYNRSLFKQAGLDPDKPPMTWSDVKADAAAISKLGGGVTGFAFPTQNNQGGWYFTSLDYSNGGSAEKRQSDGTWKASFNDAKGVATLRWLMDMRWKDNSMGTNMLQDRDGLNQLFATNKVGMFVNAIDAVSMLGNNFGYDLSNLGISQMPQNGGNATLGGGSVTMFNPRLSPTQLKAAVEWFKFKNAPDYAQRESNDQQDRAAGKVVGAPVGASMWTGDVQKRMDQIDAKYRNVDLALFKGYMEGNPRLTTKSEPPIEAQQLYHFLDGALQTALTQQGADPKQLLDQTAQQVDAILAVQG